MTSNSYQEVLNRIQYSETSDCNKCDDNSTVATSSTKSDPDLSIDFDLPLHGKDSQQTAIRRKSVTFTDKNETFLIPGRKVSRMFPRVRFCRVVEIKNIPSRNQLVEIVQDLWYTSQDIKMFANDFDSELYSDIMPDSFHDDGMPEFNFTSDQDKVQVSSSSISNSFMSCIRQTLPNIGASKIKGYQASVKQSKSKVVSMMQIMMNDNTSLPPIY